MIPLAPAVLRTSNGVQPTFLERCPVHGELVALDANERLLGRCSGCASEAARAMTFIAAGTAV